jgi:hypothetical protein
MNLFILLTLYAVAIATGYGFANARQRRRYTVSQVVMKKQPHLFVYPPTYKSKGYIINEATGQLMRITLNDKNVPVKFEVLDQASDQMDLFDEVEDQPD